MVFGPVSVMCAPKNKTPVNSSYPPPFPLFVYCIYDTAKNLTLYTYKKMSYIFSTPSNIYVLVSASMSFLH